MRLMPHSSSQDRSRLQEFTEFVSRLNGDEKGEAQLFCDRLFKAFGHEGVIEATGRLEARIRFDTGRTKFADCLWCPAGRDGVLIEMKKRGTKNLESHFPQVRDYWIEMNPEELFGPGTQKPTYVILCNFDEFVLYKHLSLVDRIHIRELVDRSSSFGFLFPEPIQPTFGHNVEAISERAASSVGELFKYLVFDKGEEGVRAQRFLLQCVLSLFSEDFGLLPDAFFTQLISDCLQGRSSYDLLGALFRQMASKDPARGGQFTDIPYFNGGLFRTVDPLELDQAALHLLYRASTFNWKYVNPSIFGSLFEGTLNSSERHAFGAHFTSEQDILKIVNPTITRPWRARVRQAETLTELNGLLNELASFRVLDPACGSGNFLFVAYRELKNVEMEVIEKIAKNFTARATKRLHLGVSRINAHQFMGIDIQPVAVEVARMTMMLAKEIASDDWNNRISQLLGTLDLSFDEGLPLDVLDDTIVCGDALLSDWPKCDAIIGNPPFQSKNKISRELDPGHLNAIRNTYPDIPGRADYCVYWFRKAHDHLGDGERAGLVGTNSIRQNYSREGGLDYIVENGGTITDSVSTEVWSGDAAVYVSIVNWIKGDFDGKKTLARQLGDNIESSFEYIHPERISAALSVDTDVTKAKVLEANRNPKMVFQGQTHGHEGFLLPIHEALRLVERNPGYRSVLHPYLIGQDLLSTPNSTPQRYVIDFGDRDVFQIEDFPELAQRVRNTVYPDRQRASSEQEQKNREILQYDEKARINRHHINFFRSWWQLSYRRQDMLNSIAKLSRYVVCVRVTKRPIFEFVDSSVRPSDALTVFAFEDDYSFGILQSRVHWEWFLARCSTLKGEWRYTSNTVFDSFPWPQSVAKENALQVAETARALRDTRRAEMYRSNMSLRQLYRVVEETENNAVSWAQENLNNAVLQCYGFSANDDVLAGLLALNGRLKASESKANSNSIVGPGVPPVAFDRDELISNDCVSD